MNKRIDYGKIALILSIVILGIFAIDFCRRLYDDWRGTQGTLNVHTSSSEVESINDASSYDPLLPDTTDTTGTSTPGGNEGPETTTSAVASIPRDASTIQVSSSNTANGSLILVNDTYAYASTPELSAFTDFNYAHLRLPVTSLQINNMMIDPLVALFNDFYAASGFGDMMVYSTTKEPGSPQYGLGIAERATGLSMDLGILNQAAGYHMPYSTSAYPWIAQNAYKYGFITRFPAGKEETTGKTAMEWHFRYVGVPHAQYIYENGLCLEEYLALVRNHTWEKEHLTVNAGGTEYEIYYVKADAGSVTDIPYPNGADPIISGDNMGGFVVACAKGAAVPAETPEEPTEPAAQ